MIQADVKLDTLGYFCPMPIIMTSKKSKNCPRDRSLKSSQTTKVSRRTCRLGVKPPAMKWSLWKRRGNPHAKRIYKAFVKKAPR